MANPFLNPVFLSKAIKSYLTDVNRIWRIEPHKLKRFQNNAFKQAVKYAYTVPIYNKKFKESNIHPNDIIGLENLNKFPFIPKSEIRNAFPDNVIPRNTNEKKLWRINTSGTTSKPVSFYRDTFGLFKDTILGVRLLKFCGINWRKDRITSMGPSSSPGRFDYANKQAISDNLSPLLPTKHQHITYIYKDLKEKMDMMNQFKPDFIIGFPGDFQMMAALRKEGYGEDINPKVIATSGGMLDAYVRSYIEDAFDCKVVDLYSSVEMGIGAVQCDDGNYHIFSDFIHLEFLDDGEPVSSGKPGHVVLTRFFGKGTPFIRYTGLDDIITPIYEECSCGLKTPLFKQIAGKVSQRIILPDGNYVTPVFFTRGVDAAMRALKTDKVLQYQVVQKSADKIDILVVIDDKKRDTSPSIDNLFKEIKEQYRKVFGDTFEFEVKEVKKVIGSDNPSKPPPIIISKTKSGKKL